MLADAYLRTVFLDHCFSSAHDLAPLMHRYACAGTHGCMHTHTHNHNHTRKTLIACGTLQIPVAILEQQLVQLMRSRKISPPRWLCIPMASLTLQVGVEKLSRNSCLYLCCIARALPVWPQRSSGCCKMAVNVIWCERASRYSYRTHLVGLLCPLLFG